MTQQDLDNAVQSNDASVAQVDATRSQIRASEAAVANAKASIVAAKAQVQSSQAVVRTAELNLGSTEIISPIDGIVGIAAAQVGDRLAFTPPSIPGLGNAGGFSLIGNAAPGLATMLDVRQAEELVYEASRTRRDELLSLVQLYRALGGGWQ